MRTHPRSRDSQIHGSWGWKRRHCQTWLESCPALYIKYHPPPRRNSESGREAMATKELDLGLEVACFLRGLARNSEDEEKAPSPKPPVKELCRWVALKAETCKTPGWWRELLAVPDMQDCEELAQKVQASFHHPKRASKLNKMKNYHQAPLHHCVSTEGIFSHLPILSLPARTLERCKERRQWHMPMLSSIWQRKLICLLEVSHTCWLRV